LAIALDPRSAEAHYRLAELLINVGRVQEALTSLEEVNRLDPLYVTSVNNRAWVLSMLGRHEEAATEIRRALSLDPRNVVSNDIAIQVFAYADRRDELAAQARAVLGQTTDAHSMGQAAWGLARAAARDEAAVVLDELEALPRDTFGRPWAWRTPGWGSVIWRGRSMPWRLPPRPSHSGWWVTGWCRGPTIRSERSRGLPRSCGGSISTSTA